MKPTEEGKKPLPDIAEITPKDLEDVPAAVIATHYDKTGEVYSKGAIFYLLESPSGAWAVVNGRYFETIRQRFPMAKMFLAVKKSWDCPITFRLGEEVVGLVMSCWDGSKPKVKEVAVEGLF